MHVSFLASDSPYILVALFMNINLHFDITYGFDGLEDGIILYLAN